MSKSFLLRARIWNDTNEQESVKGLVIQMTGYDNDKYVVHDVVNKYNGFIYKLINMRTCKFCQTDIIRPLSQKFGIGYYFDDENPQFLDDFEISILRSKAERIEQAEQDETQKQDERSEQLKAIGRERLQTLIPADAKAIIFAELRRDESDSMTDYFAHGTDRTVILGFSTHTKNLFSEMRKYAANFEETACLAEENKEYEHRENYTGGDGYYLGKSKYSGWVITKETYHKDRESIINAFALIAGNEANIKVQTTNRVEAPEAITGEFIIVDYSEKAIAVFGDTRPIKDYLTALSGRFNPKLTYQNEKRAGWIFSKTKEQEVRNLLNIK